VLWADSVRSTLFCDVLLLGRKELSKQPVVENAMNKLSVSVIAVLSAVLWAVPTSASSAPVTVKSLLACSRAPSTASFLAAVRKSVPVIYGSVGPVVVAGSLSKASKCWGIGSIDPANTSASAPANEQFQGSGVVMRFVGGHWKLVTYGTAFLCGEPGSTLPITSARYVPSVICAP